MQVALESDSALTMAATGVQAPVADAPQIAVATAPDASPAQDGSATNVVTISLSDAAKSLVAVQPTDMMGNPLSPDKIGVPGRDPLARGTAVDPDYANNLAKFQGLASVILDDTGKYSNDQKLDAWNAQFRMAVTGQLMGMGPDVDKQLNDIARSSTYQQIESARMSLNAAQTVAMQQADATGGDRQQVIAAATLKHLDKLSAFDQKLLFASLNAPDFRGNARYADMSDWRRQLEMLTGLFKTDDNSGQAGPSGAPGKLANLLA